MKLPVSDAPTTQGNLDVWGLAMLHKSGGTGASPIQPLSPIARAREKSLFGPRLCQSNNGIKYIHHICQTINVAIYSAVGGQQANIPESAVNS